MVNKPKAIGTFAETAVLKQILPYFPDASRNALAGSGDLGDIGHAGQFIFEVKGGKQTHQIGDGKLADWMAQAQIEASHSGVQFGVLVTQRSGFGAPNARRWWVHLRMEDFAEICGGFYAPGRFATVRLELGDFLDLIADQGYTPAPVGDPVTDIVLDAHALAIEAPVAAPVYVESVDLIDAMLEHEYTDTGRLSVLAEYAALDLDPQEELTDGATG